jgi:hypothetical protein
MLLHSVNERADLTEFGWFVLTKRQHNDDSQCFFRKKRFLDVRSRRTDEILIPVSSASNVLLVVNHSLLI